MGPVAANAGIPVAIFSIILVWLVLGLASAGVWLWGLIDAARRPDWAFMATGSNKTLWIVLIAVLGAIPAIIYLLAIRPKVQAAESASSWRPPTAPSPGAAFAGSKFCTRCGAALLGDARFCWRCAAAQ